MSLNTRFAVCCSHFHGDDIFVPNAKCRPVPNDDNLAVTMKQITRVCACIVIPLVFISNFVEWKFEQGALSTASLTSKKPGSASKSTKRSKNAFVTLLAGIDPYDTLPLDRTSSYLGYLLHLAAVRFMLSEAGSTMDIVVLMRLVNGTKLPLSQVAYFSKLNVRIEYLAPGTDNFFSLVMDKFQILRLLEYKQILFFDADVLPLCNWDHYFNLATASSPEQHDIFAPNLVFAYNNEPAQGGFFLITPEPGDWEAFQQLHFINASIGFGSPLEEPAEGLRHQFTEWNWHFSKSDQGMLYHWVRYVKRDVTLVIKNRAKRWRMNGNETTVLEVRDFNLTCPNHIQLKGARHFHTFPVIRDMVHYTGPSKPWIKLNWSSSLHLDKTERTQLGIWAVALRMAWTNYDLGALRDLIPNASSGSHRDIEIVQAFLSQNFSTAALDTWMWQDAHSEWHLDPPSPEVVVPGNTRALNNASGDLATRDFYSHTKRKTHSQNAAFTLLVGINPFDFEPLSSHSSYLGYLLHLAAVRYLLDETGSTMDFNILLRVREGLNSNLPEPQLKFFSKLRLNIEYLPPKRKDSWGSDMLEKFNILRYYEYKRVLFVDADVLPLCNWDHFFNMSDRGVLAPNTVFAWQNEPAQGGFFLLSPEPGDWEMFRSIPAFTNSSLGFGVPLAEPVHGIRHTFTNWSWHGVKDDQGMLFHWVRYVKKNVTLLKADRLQKWQEVDGVVKMVEETIGFNATCPNSIDFRHTSAPDLPLVRDFVHYHGRQKAWQMMNWTSPIRNQSAADLAKLDLWTDAVRKAWQMYDLGPVRQLIPNISSSFDDCVELVERFLRKN